MADDTKPHETTGPKEELDVEDIVRRVDSLPVLDPRSPDEIVAYDENELPSGAERARRPDFEARAKSILGDRVLEDFLNYRHREWEENLGSGSNPTNEDE